jgi:hypothetical protein
MYMYLDVRMHRGLAKSLESTHEIGNDTHPTANCGSTDGPFQVGCLMFTTTSFLPHLPCDFHCSQSCCSPTHTFATPWLISPLPLVILVPTLSHCTAIFQHAPILRLQTRQLLHPQEWHAL